MVAALSTRVRLLFVASAAVLGMASGCRGFLGIDDDLPGLNGTDGGDMPGDDGAVASSDARVDPDAGLDARIDAIAPDGGADGGPLTDAIDRRYAAWPVPPDSLSATDYEIGETTVVDKRTGLEWQKTGGEATRHGAVVNRCADLELNGASDWRLPTRIELVSIVNFARGPQWLLPKDVFDETPVRDGLDPGKDYFWTEHAGLGVQFSSTSDYASAIVISPPASDPLRSRCVRVARPKQLPAKRLDVETDVVHDHWTHLAWARAAAVEKKDLGGAIDYCTALRLEQKAGWRVPTVRELLTVADDARLDGVTVKRSDFDPAIFPRPPSDATWSTSPLIEPGGSSDRWWTFQEKFGTATWFYGSTQRGARCVRDEP